MDDRTYKQFSDKCWNLCGQKCSHQIALKLWRYLVAEFGFSIRRPSEGATKLANLIALGVHVRGSLEE